MENQPPVSCFCLTYGRPRLLEEAIHSFLQQDYAGPKEMIVLNDYADQILELDHPEVRVINLPKRFRTLGEKMNTAVALASHDVLFTWDDDDIYLPHRLRFSTASFDPSKGFFKAASAWMWSDDSLSGPAQNRFHAASCWSRALFDTIGGYAADGSGTDAIFERQLEARFPGATAPFATDRRNQPAPGMAALEVGGALSRAGAGRRFHGHAPRNPEDCRSLRRRHAAMGLGGHGAVRALLAVGL